MADQAWRLDSTTLSETEFNAILGRSHTKPNSSHQWRNTDSHDAWVANNSDPKTRSWLQDLGWTSSSITYAYNNLGFRSHTDWYPQATRSGTMFLGCSITEGIGLNLEDTWAWKLGTALGGPVYNMGQAGTGLDCQYRLIKAWAHVLRPIRAYTIGGFPDRREALMDDGWQVMGPWSEQHARYLAKYVYHADQDSFHRTSMFDAIRAVCMDNGIELYRPSKAMHEAIRVFDGRDRGRDLIHRGRSWHDKIASVDHSLWERVS